MQTDSSTQYTWRDLLSADPDTVERAANAIYASGSAAETFADPAASQALLESVRKGNRTAAAVLLLGLSEPGKEALKSLRREHGGEMVKLKPWARMVPLDLAALAALARGRTEDRHELLERIPSFDNAARVFLLDLLPYFGSPAVWHALSAYFEDKSEIPEGVPSGAPQRRVCDLAVDAFLDGLALDVSFERRPGGRYDPTQIEETRQRLAESVPM